MSDLVEPTFWLQPDYAFTFGDRVADLGAMAGFPPDEEQRLVLDAVFAERSDGLPAAFETVVVCPRQNLKSGSFELVALGWLFLTEEPRIVWSAHEFRTAADSLEHLAGLIEATPKLSRRVRKIVLGPVATGITMRDGRKLQFVARTHAGSRGKSAPKLILDEALALQSSHMGALMPIMSTFPNAQIVYGSSAGLPSSSELRGLRNRGRRMDREREPRLAYLEWTGDQVPGVCARGEDCSHLYGVDGCKLDDRERLRAANPQAGKRISWEYLANERRAMKDPREYMRERLGYWDDPAQEAALAVDPSAWASLVDRDSQVAGDPVFALDVSPARTWSSIVAGGWNQSRRLHVELTSRRGEFDHRPGTTWLLPRFRELAEAFPGATVLILAKSQAAILASQLTELGFQVELVQSGDWPAACAMFLDLVTTERLAHLGEIELSAAVGAAVAVSVGEEQIRWGRAKSAGDISALAAATLLAWHFGDKPDYDILSSGY